MSRDVAIDESVKKASRMNGRHIFKYYRLKNNDYGFAFVGLHGGLSEPITVSRVQVSVTICGRRYPRNRKSQDHGHIMGKVLTS